MISESAQCRIYSRGNRWDEFDIWDTVDGTTGTDQVTHSPKSAAMKLCEMCDVLERGQRRANGSAPGIVVGRRRLIDDMVPGFFVVFVSEDNWATEKQYTGEEFLAKLESCQRNTDLEE